MAMTKADPEREERRWQQVVAGLNGVPGDATAVVLNVTVVDGTASS